MKIDDKLNKIMENIKKYIAKHSKFKDINDFNSISTPDYWVSITNFSKYKLTIYIMARKDNTIISLDFKGPNYYTFDTDYHTCISKALNDLKQKIKVDLNEYKKHTDKLQSICKLF